ncbi:MAG TPA: LysR family transcriptional regulator, partial [Bdellovibrionales bacterium]|nr:LysR family transcriptional regulator [Bdellovibrionales bacterium]
MSLSSLYLDAFSEVAKLKSFSKAAQKLNVTQSALSQRVLNLEKDLGSSLFIRDPSGIRLTELGQRLLRYCHSKSLLEAEFMEALKPDEGKGLSGLIRVGGFSTINRSVILPIMTGVLKEHPLVNI